MPVPATLRHEILPIEKSGYSSLPMRRSAPGLALLLGASLTQACRTPQQPATAPPLEASAPAPLPPPLPPPLLLEDQNEGEATDGGPAEVPPAPDDPEEFLYAHRINFAAGGAPLVTVRLMEGQDLVEISGRTNLAVSPYGMGERRIGVPADRGLRVTLAEAKPAEVAVFTQVADLELADREGTAQQRALWEQRGYGVRSHVIGTVYGVAGHVLDNRRVLLLLDLPDPVPVDPVARRAAAEDQRREIAQRFGEKTELFEVLHQRPHGVLALSDEGGAPLGKSHDLVVIDAQGDGEIAVHRVEYGVGYAFHGFADRLYRGRIYVAVDRLGKLAVIEALPLEELLRGLVPSEMFASAPREALRAQAVTARGEVLAKIGARHLGDPYLLCAEQHCQVYAGLAAQRSSTDAAVAATHGEALFSQAGVLVDSVYSAVCGGHTENNEVVWGGPPNPALRGVSDLAAGEGPLPSLRSEAALRAYVDQNLEGYCRLSGAAAGKFRWTRRFSSEELDRLVAPLSVGHVLELMPRDRGVSGRTATLKIVGTSGSAEVHGELNIRRLLHNLNSSAFVVDRVAPEGGPRIFVLRGAGWGHGVGMCQTGAVGRAQRGKGYREILGHYFNGAEIAKIY
jgi:stage II sporulation protein D